MSTTQTYTKPFRRHKKAVAVMPVLSLHTNNNSSDHSSQRHGLNFFRRTIGAVRKKSVSSQGSQTNGYPSVSDSLPPSPDTPTSPQIPQIAIRQPTFHSDDMSTDDSSSYADPNGVGRKLRNVPEEKGEAGLKNGIRFAQEGLEPAEDYPDFVRTRTRSNSGRTRRSSIYARTTDGDYPDGVDAGVGSKARQLSVMIPDDYLQVDECRLDEHFGRVARMRKEKVGEGGAATVQKMHSKTAGSTGKDKVFAVKEFRPWDCNEEREIEYERKIKSEYAIAKSLEHPNIVTTYRLCHAENLKRWYHVMDYCDLGDLNDAINNGYFHSREDRTCMFKQLLRGIDYLHSRGIAHRDIKSENLLLTSTGCLKIADFGTSEVFSGTHPGMRNCRRPSLIDSDAEIRMCAPGLVGSRPYMAPELIQKAWPYDPRAVDIWSCGIVLLTLMIGGTPWEEASTNIKNFNIFCSSWDEWLDRYPDAEVELERRLPAFAGTRQFQELGDHGTKCIVFGLLHPDPKHRWTARKALDCQIVAEYPCCQQDGYSDDIRTRQRKALHNHGPAAKSKKGAPHR